MQKNIIIIVGVLVVIASIWFLTSNTREPKIINSIDNQPASAIKSELTQEINKMTTATLKTNKGEITIEFFDAQAPKTVANFTKLAKDGFYDGVKFHRVIKGFMIQGGDPEGTGRGGPGYKFDDESFEGDYTRGTVAMANAGPNTNGSQFFIMHKDNNLPKNYTIFGKVTKGLDVVDKIAEAPVEAGGEGSTPKKPVTVESVVISED